MLTELFCRGADDQQRTFYVELPERLESWPLHVRVHRASPPRPETDDWFSLTLDQFRDGLIVVEITHNFKEWYSRKGIGDALLPEVARITGLRIYSSSNTHKAYPKEYRSIGAGTLWLRLLQEEIATYVPEEDRFYLPGHAAAAELSSSEVMTAAFGARPAKPPAVFPDILPISYKRGRFLPLQYDDVASKGDLDRLLDVLYDDPDCEVYLYFERGKPLKSVLEEARSEGVLDLDEINYYFYKHPAARSRRSYLQITPDQLESDPQEEWDQKYLLWKKAIVAVGPMFGQIIVRLTPRMRRLLEMRQAAAIQREADPRLPNRRVHVEDIDSFARVRDVQPSQVTDLLDDAYLELSEDRVQTALEEILAVPLHKKDWGGELNDLYTANIVLGGQRVETAFLLKGNGLRKKTMEIGDCGKNGDQLVRLIDSPARLFVVQFVGNISENVIRDIDGKVAKLRSDGIQAFYCIVDGQDTARLFRAYGIV